MASRSTNIYQESNEAKYYHHKMFWECVTEMEATKRTRQAKKATKKMKSNKGTNRSI